MFDTMNRHVAAFRLYLSSCFRSSSKRTLMRLLVLSIMSDAMEYHASMYDTLASVCQFAA